MFKYSLNVLQKIGKLLSDCLSNMKLVKASLKNTLFI